MVRRVHVQQHEFPALDLLGDGAVLVPGNGCLHLAGEHVAAAGHFLDVLVSRHHPVATIVEATLAHGLFVPPDRRDVAQFGQLRDRQPLRIDIGVGEVESGWDIGCRHVTLLTLQRVPI